jgi:hypothetical protein
MIFHTPNIKKVIERLKILCDHVGAREIKANTLFGTSKTRSQKFAAARSVQLINQLANNTEVGPGCLESIFDQTDGNPRAITG